MIFHWNLLFPVLRAEIDVYSAVDRNRSLFKERPNGEFSLGNSEKGLAVSPAIAANGHERRFAPKAQRKWIMAEGTVRWFSIKKGFGFIERLRGKDVLVHSVAIRGGGVKSLSEGDTVQFETVQGPKGPQAANVRRLGFSMPEELNTGGGIA